MEMRLVAYMVVKQIQNTKTNRSVSEIVDSKTTNAFERREIKAKVIQVLTSTRRG